jgi:hypothetical protein
MRFWLIEKPADAPTKPIVAADFAVVDRRPVYLTAALEPILIPVLVAIVVPYAAEPTYTWPKPSYYESRLSNDVRYVTNSWPNQRTRIVAVGTVSDGPRRWRILSEASYGGHTDVGISRSAAGSTEFYRSADDFLVSSSRNDLPFANERLAQVHHDDLHMTVPTILQSCGNRTITWIEFDAAVGALTVGIQDSQDETICWIRIRLPSDMLSSVWRPCVVLSGGTRVAVLPWPDDGFPLPAADVSARIVDD